MGSTPTPAPQAVRLDRWLWAARCFRTRSLASAACSAGHVKLNGTSAKASKMVRPGDHIVIRTSRGDRLLDVAGLSERRGPASVARELYIDKTPPPPPKEEKPAEVIRDRGLGRPSKRDRRKLDRLRGK